MVLAIILIIFVYYITTSNKLEKLLVKIKEAESGIDVALVKRYDTLTKMLDVTKGYAKHEQETLLEAVKIRKDMGISEKVDVDNKMNRAANSFSVLAEEYPNLKTNTVFIELQKSIVDIEENLQASRRLYNSNVSIFNQDIVRFPKSVVAKIKGLKEQKMFQAEFYEKEDIVMNFND